MRVHHFGVELFLTCCRAKMRILTNPLTLVHEARCGVRSPWFVCNCDRPGRWRSKKDDVKADMPRKTWPTGLSNDPARFAQKAHNGEAKDCRYKKNPHGKSLLLTNRSAPNNTRALPASRTLAFDFVLGLKRLRLWWSTAGTGNKIST